MEKTTDSLQYASLDISGGAGTFSPIQVVLKGTRKWLRTTPDPKHFSKIGGGDYKIHGNTHHSGPPASKQLTILHQVLRWLCNWHMGSLEICTKQDRPYHVARRVATEGKGPIQ